MKASAIGIGIAASLLLLGGCAADGDIVPDGPLEPLVDGCAPSGATVEGIVVSTNQDLAPDLEYQAPLSVSSTERLVVVEGTGETVDDLDQVLIAYALYNGGSGDMLGHIGYEGEAPVPFPVDLAAPYLEGISYTLLCTTVGSRVVGVIPAGQAYGEEGAPQFGLEPGAPVIFVADVMAIQPPPDPPLARLTGALKDAPENFPEISYEMSGKPSVTVAPSQASWDFQMARVIDGDGQEVYAGASVIVQYMGINMTTGKEFDSSWSRGQPTTLATSNLVPGFRDALVGQKVGSRVLVVIPPALGYGSQGTIDGRVGPNDSMFFVIDILGVF